VADQSAAVVAYFIPDLDDATTGANAGGDEWEKGAGDEIIATIETNNAGVQDAGLWASWPLADVLGDAVTALACITIDLELTTVPNTGDEIYFWFGLATVEDISTADDTKVAAVRIDWDNATRVRAKVGSSVGGAPAANAATRHVTASFLLSKSSTSNVTQVNKLTGYAADISHAPVAGAHGTDDGTLVLTNTVFFISAVLNPDSGAPTIGVIPRVLAVSYPSGVFP